MASAAAAFGDKAWQRGRLGSSFMVNWRKLNEPNICKDSF